MAKKFDPPTIQELEEFDKVRRLYPGIKRGNPTEIGNFTTKHPDWKQSLPLLYPAIETQIRCRQWAVAENARRMDFRRQQIFIPPWKNFKTWISQRCWEDSLLPEYLESSRKAELTREREEQGKIARHEELKAEWAGWVKEQSVRVLLARIKAMPHHKAVILELRPDVVNELERKL